MESSTKPAYCRVFSLFVAHPKHTHFHLPPNSSLNLLGPAATNRLKSGPKTYFGECGDVKRERYGGCGLVIDTVGGTGSRDAIGFTVVSIPLELGAVDGP